MATYKQLLLRDGGGILPSMQQIPLPSNSVHLLIGLGGTGIDCLREIKTEVKERFQPDDPNVSEPSYHSLQFLAVDSDPVALDGFDPSETFLLHANHVPPAIAVHHMPEFDWLDPDHIANPHFDGHGACGVRQLGRALFMLHSHMLLSTIRTKLQQFSAQMPHTPLCVHIFSGLSGGTGSGIFLDVCYNVRHILEQTYGNQSAVLGYFFLPDVAAIRVPHHAEPWRIAHMHRTGYAAMQELDYCMRIPEHGNTFSQIYQNHNSIHWDKPPVDLCHLISAADADAQFSQNAYHNALKITAEHVLEFFNIANPLPHVHSLMQMVASNDHLKTHGYNPHYLSIGAASVSIPLKHINTYLATKVFAASADIDKNTPTKDDIDAIANATKLSDIPALFAELTRNTNGSYLTSILDICDYKDAKLMDDDILMQHYTRQRDVQLNTSFATAKNMMDPNSTASLSRRICEMLDKSMIDLHKGPIYVHKMVDHSIPYTLLSVLDRVLYELESRIAFSDSNFYHYFKQPFEEAQSSWHANQRNPLKSKRVFMEYLDRLHVLITEEIRLETSKQLCRVLREVKAQLESKAQTYYGKFRYVMETLTHTFEANWWFFENNSHISPLSAVDLPLIKLEEIIPTLDATLNAINPDCILEDFIHDMLTPDSTGETCWETNDECKISRAVTDFFTNGSFIAFTRKTIDDYLAEKYGTQNTLVLTQHVYDEYLLMLKDAATPMFPIRHDVDFGNIPTWNYIATPNMSIPVTNAAQQLHFQNAAYTVYFNSSRNRISILHYSCALPMVAYRFLNRCEQDYYTSELHGIHIYGGQGSSNHFNNWNQMLPITPASLLTPVPHLDRRDALWSHTCKLYDSALQYELLVGNDVMTFSQAASDQAEAMYENIVQIENHGEEGRTDRQALQDAQQAIGEMMRNKELLCHLPSGASGIPDIEEQIRKDYFFISPALHGILQDDIAKIKKYFDKLAELQAEQ